MYVPSNDNLPCPIPLKFLRKPTRFKTRLWPNPSAEKQKQCGLFYYSDSSFNKTTKVLIALKGKTAHRTGKKQRKSSYLKLEKKRKKTTQKRKKTVLKGSENI